MGEFLNRDGVKEKSLERVAIERLGGTESFKKRYYDTEEGAARLSTKDGMPQVVVEEEITTTSTLGKVLDFLSGIVFGGELVSGFMQTFFPKEETATKFSMVKNSPYSMARMAISLSDLIGGPVAGYSQYEGIRASFYSGRMRALAQFVLGIGFVKHPSWYALNKTLPEFVYSSYLDAAPVAIKYGYTFDTTHGVCLGNDGEPWLILISKTDGVWAFLLPREAGTNTTEFATAISEDIEGAVVLSQFKGFPTGEVPQPYEFVQWIKSGCGMQLLRPDQMARYVDSVAVSSQLGWAFSYSGDEARVVGMKNIVGAGIDYYENSYMHLVFDIPSSRARNTSDTALANIIKYGFLVKAKPWLRNKLDYMSPAQAATLSGKTTESSDSVLTWLESIDVDPITTPSAIFSVIETVPLRVLPGLFKVWSPALEICASLSLPFVGAPPSPSTAMLNVFFSESGLVETRWYAGTPSQTPGIICTLYSAVAPIASTSATSSQWVQTVLGPKSINLQLHGDNVLEYFRKFWWTESSRIVASRNNVDGLGSAFIPYGDREALVLAKLTTDTGGETTTEYQQGSIEDSRSYAAATMFINGPSPYEPGEIVNAYGCSLPYNQDIFVRNDPLARPDWGGAVNNGHGELTWPQDPPGSRYDGGVWSSPCTVMQDQTWATPTLPSNVVNSTAPIGTFDVMFLSGGVVYPLIQDSGTPTQMHFLYDIWFKPSTPTSDPQTLRAAINCLGPTPTYQCYDDINSGKYKIFGDVTNALIATSNPCYIGIV